MFFVMVEISNFRQLSRLRESEASDVRHLLEHFCQNRGGRLVREQNGFFLFSFHPLREKVLDQVSDFLFLTSDSLKRKEAELFGFSLLLDQDDQLDEAAVFSRLKALIFLASRENRIWAGPGVLPSIVPLFPVAVEESLAEILGPPVRSSLPPLPVENLLEMTGWIEALKAPLGRQLADQESRPGKILRLKGSHLTEKFFVLGTVLRQLYGPQDNFPVLFPIQDSRDFLSQLLARVEDNPWRTASPPADPVWGALLECRGGGEYPGDSARDDVVGALTFYFRAVIRDLIARRLPPIFVFLFPHGYEPEAQAVLETILTDLVQQDGLRLLLLEHQDTGQDFLAGRPSLSWSFPPLSLDRVIRERDLRGWKDRFPNLDPAVLEGCDGRGMAWVHYLWILQERQDLASDAVRDPSWTLFLSLDSTHHKVYLAVWAGRGLLDESQLVPFFQQWGEDAAVIADKVSSLRDLGFFLDGLTRPLRSDFGPRLVELLGEEGRELLTGLGQFLYRQWTKDHRLSEVLFGFLRDRGLHGPSVDVLTYYLTNKINQGQGDFLTLLRPDLWEKPPTEELKETFRLIAAAAKLRFALNLKTSVWTPPNLDRFRRAFTSRTETFVNGEWQLQQGRFHLRVGAWSAGFSLLKKALLEAQERDDRPLEVRAETEIGLALLRRNRIEEGREYFDIASRLAEKTRSSYLVSLTAGLDAVALFLLGHLSSASKALDRGSAAAHRGGHQQGKVFHAFLRGRIFFDLGDYTRAREVLEAGLAVAQRYRVEDAVPILTAWMCRAEAHSGNGTSARSALTGLSPTAEIRFFLAESAYLDRDWEGALSWIREAKSLVRPTRPFGTGERTDWESGYACVEDRALAASGDPGVLETQILAFEAFLEGGAGKVGPSLATFQEILGRKFLLDLDPASAQIYYWYYLTVPKNDSTQEAFRLTLLGRALKDVQVRSSRIEDPVQRQEYLSKPLWNAQFAAEARKLKLL